MALDAVGQAMGLALFGSLFLALSISVTSIVIVMRVLEELGMMKDQASTLLLGVAVIEDIIVISVLAVLQSVAATGNLSFQDIGISTGLVLAFIGGVLFIGSRTVPRFVDIIGKTNHHDLVVVVAVCLAWNLALRSSQTTSASQ